MERMPLDSDNYDAEMAARMEVLDAGERRGARCALIFVDATSPITAFRRFRRQAPYDAGASTAAVGYVARVYFSYGRCI